MPVLTNARHEKFCQERAKGKTFAEAYALAGFAPDDGNATKLGAKPHIQERVREITGNAARRAEVSIASIIEELEESRLLAMSIKQPAPAVSASLGKAKVAGLLIDKTEHTGKDGGPIEVNDLESARRIAFALAKATVSREE